jgi:two-component system response regulator
MGSSWILLAEDNDDDLTLALRAIRKSGIDSEIVVARDGLEALNLLGLNSDCKQPECPPDLILLDIKMPMVGGIDVLDHIRACDPYKMVPVVMLSSSDEPKDLRHAYETGANSYTVKPVTYEEYISQVVATVLYWSRINRVPKPTPVGA